MVGKVDSIIKSGGKVDLIIKSRVEVDSKIKSGGEVRINLTPFLTECNVCWPWPSLNP